jgi:CheY-like chemotaxis protein
MRIDCGDISGMPLVTPSVGQEQSSADTPRSGPNKVSAEIKVLLVEDGDTNRKLIKLLLERAGAQVATAENGAVGCQIALKESFDVILMDMQMPVLDGYSASRRLRDAGLTLPIIALTAHTMTGDREKCLDSGCTDYLTKPINAEHMFAAIERAIRATAEGDAIAAGANVDTLRTT